MKHINVGCDPKIVCLEEESLPTAKSRDVVSMRFHPTDHLLPGHALHLPKLRPPPAAWRPAYPAEPSQTSKPIELGGVLAQYLALDLGSECRHLLGHSVEWLGVQTGGMREVGLKEHVVLTNRSD